MKKKVLDITNMSCPMSFLKAKEFLKTNINIEKRIIIKGERDFCLLNNSLKRNYEISVTKKGKDIFEIDLA
ncbi:MAG: hypothetical protein CBC25_03880 [Pelagibacteraceae bacterium TMED65]|nr:hypothetical protein [Rickettsiales bacterium]OUU52012.1 MAG: hypothetical protein CBC25_03880 [Pelagibacteraceae bacterium TMED65]|tara:strand:- start:965 stop:1177 length:213 start_codon:yes stop_codon:yes gene_type:complete